MDLQLQGTSINSSHNMGSAKGSYEFGLVLRWWLVVWQWVVVRSEQGVVVEVAAKEVEVVIEEGKARLEHIVMVCESRGWISCLAVSYTHLTLPTTPYV